VNGLEVFVRTNCCCCCCCSYSTNYSHGKSKSDINGPTKASTLTSDLMNSKLSRVHSCAFGIHH